MIAAYLELNGIAQWSIPDDLKFHASGKSHLEQSLTLLPRKIKSHDTAFAANGDAAERIHGLNAHAATRSTCTWVLNSRPIARRIP